MSFVFIIPFNGYSAVCEDDEVMSFIYLNGIMNSTEQSQANADRVFRTAIEGNFSKKLYGEDGMKFCPQVAYNQKDGLLLDLIETFAQKYRERSPETFSYEMVAKWIFDKKDFIETFLPRLPGSDPNSNNFDPNLISSYESLTEDLIADFVRKGASRESTTNLKISNKLDQIIIDEKKRTVLISHSQGNLFANDYYQEFASDEANIPFLKRLANLQVGSAAATVAAKTKSFGDHMTGKQDNIIGALETLGFAINPPNIEYDRVSIINKGRGTGLFENIPVLSIFGSIIRNSPDLVQGHSFLNIYTAKDVNGKLDGEDNYRSMASIFSDKFEALARKIAPPKLVIEPIEQINNNGTLAQRLKIVFAPDENRAGELIDLSKLTTFQVDNGSGIYEEAEPFNLGAIDLNVNNRDVLRLKFEYDFDMYELEYDFMNVVNPIENVEVFNDSVLNMTVGITFNSLGAGLDFIYQDFDNGGQEVRYTLSGNGYQEIVVKKSFNAQVFVLEEEPVFIDASLKLEDTITNVEYLSNTSSSMRIRVHHRELSSGFPLIGSVDEGTKLGVGLFTDITVKTEGEGSIYIPGGREWDTSLPEDREYTFDGKFIEDLKGIITNNDSQRLVQTSFEGNWTFSYIPYSESGASNEPVVLNYIAPSTGSLNYLLGGCSLSTVDVPADDPDDAPVKEIHFFAQNEYLLSNANSGRVSSCADVNLDADVYIVYKSNGKEIRRRKLPIYFATYSSDVLVEGQ